MTKKIIFIHGRDIKPLKEDLCALWYDAIIAGLKRDIGVSGVERFNSISKDFVYYGDLSNAFLHKHNNTKIPDDIKSRKEALAILEDYRRSEFRKSIYNGLEKKSALKEALADSFSGLLSTVGIGGTVIELFAPDIRHYWNKEKYFGSDIRYVLTKYLKDAFDVYDEIMLVSHSLGTIISYDCLWKFSHYGEYRKNYGKNKKIDLFVTMGSPLGDENVRKQLKGRESDGVNKYPNNIRQWINISAEDDFILHDNRVKNDFQDMYKKGLLEKPIKDIYPIYNLTVRNGISNPHSSIGYLIHPKFINLLSNWMTT